MLHHHKGKNKGFTLAELLIVVAILAVLVAIAIPIFVGQIKNAREKTYIYNCRNLVQAAQLIAMEDYEANTLDSGFLSSHKKDIFATAGLSQSGGSDITQLTFGEDSVTIQTLAYRPVAGVIVRYNRDGDPMYVVGKETGIASYQSQWETVLNGLTYKGTGAMEKALGDAGLPVKPPLTSEERRLLAGNTNIAGIKDTALDGINWHPVEVNSAPNGYLHVAASGAINATMIYYNGSYYVCVGKGNGLKLDNFITTKEFDISLLTNATAMSEYEKDISVLQNQVNSDPGHKIIVKLD